MFKTNKEEKNVKVSICTADIISKRQKRLKKIEIVTKFNPNWRKS